MPHRAQLARRLAFEPHDPLAAPGTVFPGERDDAREAAALALVLDAVLAEEAVAGEPALVVEHRGAGALDLDVDVRGVPALGVRAGADRAQGDLAVLSRP